MALLSPTTSVRLALAFAGLMWVVPFVQPLAWRPLTHFFHEWFAAVLGFGVVAFLVRRTREPDPVPTESALMLLFAAVLGLQPLGLPLPYWEPSLAHAAFVTWAGALVLAGRALREAAGAERCASTIAHFAMTGAVLAAAVGLMQRFGHPEFLTTLVPHIGAPGLVPGPIRHQSWFADHLVLGLAATGWLAATGRLSRLPTSLAGLLMAAAIGLSGSRGPALMMVAGCAFAAAVWWRTRAPWSSRMLAWQTLWGAAYAAVVIVAPALPGGTATGVTTLERLHSADATGLGTRWDLWHRALMSFLDSPLRGHGPDGFGWAAYRLAEGPALCEYTIHAHNLPLQLMVVAGISGLVFLCALSILQWRAVKHAWIDPPGWLFTTMLSALLIRACVDLPTHMAFFLGPMAILTGMLSQSRLRVRSEPVRAAVAVGLFAGLALAAQALGAYRDIASLWRETQSAAALSQRYKWARQSPFFTPLADSIILDAAALERTRAAAIVVNYARYLRWRPHPRAAMRYGVFLALARQDEGSCRWLVRASRLYPSFAGEFAKSMLPQEAVQADPVIATTRRWIERSVDGEEAASVCAGLVRPATRPR